MKAVHTIAWILLVIGGLNWLLIGAFDLNVVAYVGTTLARIIYVLVGISAVWEIISHKKNCSCCVSKAASTPQM